MPASLTGILKGTFSLLSIVVGACSAGYPDSAPAQGSSQRVRGDTALFAAAIQAIYDGPDRDFLRVDPRPLKADPEIVTLNSSLAKIVPDRVGADSTPLAHVSSEVVRRRLEVLRRLDVKRADALNRPPCAGTMVPWDRRPSIREGCPEEGQIKIAILGLPRPGGAYWSQSVDKREEGLRKGHWSVRVLEWVLGPEGSIGTASDFVFERTSDNTAWKLVERVPLFVIE